MATTATGTGTGARRTGTGPGRERPPIERARRPSVGQLVSDVSEGLTSLVKQEVELAKVELRGEAIKAGQAGAALAVAAVAALMLALFGSVTLMFALALVLPYWLSALIVAALWGLLAAIAGLVGARLARTLRPVPEQMIASVKEDVRWLRDRMR
jgi:hypothetical protein